MSLFERIKNIRYDLQEKKKFPGDESGAYKQAKDDLEARKGFKKNKPGGLKADEKNPFVKRSVRKARVDKLGGDIYDAPKFSQKEFEKSFKSLPKSVFDKSFKAKGRNLSGGAKVPQIPIIPDPFGKGDTPGETRVKGLERKAFKKTKPSNVKLPKEFTDFSKKLRRLKSDVQDFKDKDIATMRTGKSSSKVKVSGANNLTRQDVGMAPPDKPTKSATEYTKQINQANKNRKEFTGIKKTSKNTMSSGKDFITKNRKQAETATTNLRKKVDKIAKNPNLTGSKKAELSRIEMKKLKVAQNYARGYANPKTAQTAITVPKDIKTVQSAAKGAITKPPKEPVLPNIPKEVRVGASGRLKTKGPVLLDDIPVKNVPREIRFGRTSSAVLKKTPKAIKPIARPALKLLAKAGAPGRIAAAGLGVAAISPAGRKALGQLATGAGLTALFGRGKKEKQLKVGDGLKNVGKVRVTADSKGLKRNQADMAKIKATQKNFIDKYNKGRAFGKIKYNVNKQGTYDVIKPKKK